jgi:hypothetical protein
MFFFSCCFRATQLQALRLLLASHPPKRIGRGIRTVSIISRTVRVQSDGQVQPNSFALRLGHSLQVQLISKLTSTRSKVFSSLRLFGKCTLRHTRFKTHLPESWCMANSPKPNSNHCSIYRAHVNKAFLCADKESCFADSIR